MRVSFTINENYHHFNARYRNIMTDLEIAIGKKRLEQLTESDNAEEWNVTIHDGRNTVSFSLTEEEYNKAVRRKDFRKYVRVIDY
jgi:hypothetical protein